MCFQQKSLDFVLNMFTIIDPRIRPSKRSGQLLYSGHILGILEPWFVGSIMEFFVRCPTATVLGQSVDVMPDLPTRWNLRTLPSFSPNPTFNSMVNPFSWSGSDQVSLQQSVFLGTSQLSLRAEYSWEGWTTRVHKTHQPASEPNWLNWNLPHFYVRELNKNRLKSIINSLKKIVTIKCSHL